MRIAIPWSRRSIKRLSVGFLAAALVATGIVAVPGAAYAVDTFTATRSCVSGTTCRVISNAGAEYVWHWRNEGYQQVKIQTVCILNSQSATCFTCPPLVPC
jgi:hypothetical protein